MSNSKISSHQQAEINYKSIVLSCVRSVLLDLPLLTIFTILVSSYCLKSIYNGPLLELRNALRRENEYNNEGFLTEYDKDITYYNRICTSEDISTRDANDLLLNSNQSSREIADVMLEHGAVVIPNVLNDTTAKALREYLEVRNDIDESKAGLGWQEKFWGEMGRLALGLGRDDDPIIAQALHEVGSNALIKNMLEAIVGEDPALVEMSTLTAKYGCEEQGIHTDSDYFGSSLLYSRTFLHSYTMFMALQDTPAKMGATTICPGTHMCANADLDHVCSSPDNIFEASSNGHTGPEVGVLKLGDAMMYNQNIWHRGPENYDPNYPNMNRVMFILTFVSRRQYELGDARIQGLGTYYYYRWNQWGHTYNDLKYAITSTTSATTSYYYNWFNKKTIRFSLPWSIFKALGLYNKIYDGENNNDQHMGISWIEHFARQLSNAEDFYADDELPEFKNYIIQYTPSWVVDARKLLSDKNNWEEFLEETLNNIYHRLKMIYLISFGIYIGIHMALSLLLVLSGNNNNFRMKYLIRSRHNMIIVVGHVTIILLSILIYQSITHYSYLGNKIQTGQYHIQPFPTTTTTTTNNPQQETTTTSNNNKLKHTTVPERMDILFGTRFDTNYLESYNRMLEFHPGNHAFYKLVKQTTSTLLSNDHHSDCDLAISFIYQSIRRPIKGVIPRMLQQDYATGYWTVIDDEKTQSLKIIQEILLEEQFPFIKVLSYHLKSVLADARFGPRRELTMTSRFSVAFVDYWQRILFLEINNRTDNSTTSSKTTTTTPGHIQQRNPWKIKSQLKVPKINQIIISNTDNHNKVLAKTTISATNNYYAIGDRIMALYGDEGLYYEATIIEIIQDGYYYTIIFNDDDEEYDEYSVPYDSLQKYKPFSQGDLVEVKVQGDNDDWSLALIIEATPFGLYHIEFVGTEIREYDICKEFIRWPVASTTLEDSDD